MIRSFGSQKLSPILNTNNWEQPKAFVGARGSARRSAFHGPVTVHGKQQGKLVSACHKFCHVWTAPWLLNF